MELYFVRHAQSENNALMDRTGSTKGRLADSPLTRVGHRQAKLLARHLARRGRKPPHAPVDYRNNGGYRITHVYCSLMDRAVATGSYVSHALGLPLQGHLDMHESGGLFEEDEQTGELRGLPGRSPAEFQRDYPRLRLPENTDERGWWNRPPEPREHRPQRARRILHWLVDAHGETDDRVVMISHGGFFNWFLFALLGSGDMAKNWIHMNNTAITRVDFLEGMNVVQYVNRAEHLSPELIT